MTGTNHVLTGALIGLSIHQPVLALPLALTSHFVLDSLPHYGNSDLTSKEFLRVLAFDGVGVVLVLASLVIRQPLHWQLAIICGLVAASPDFMWLPNFLRDLGKAKGKRQAYTNPITRFHKRIQWSERPGNYPIEFLWMFAAMALLVRFR